MTSGTKRDNMNVRLKDPERKVFKMPPVQNFADLCVLFIRAIISSIFWGLVSGILFYIFASGNSSENFMVGFKMITYIPFFIAYLLVLPVVGWICIIPAYCIWMSFFGWEIYPFGTKET